MKWLKNKSSCGHIVLWLLNNRIFFFYQPLHRGYEFELRFYITERHEISFYGYGDFNWKHPFSAAFKFKRTRAKLSIALFGWEVSFRIGEVVCDEYDAHRDIYFPYGELVNPTEWHAYLDKEMTIPENYVKPQPEEYKDFYVSKLLKIYNKDYRNCQFGRVFDFALPFQHYFKIDFRKPFEFWEWLGFAIDIDFTKGFGIFTKLILCKLTLILRLGKDSLERTSNLRSVAAIERYFSLKSKRNNKIDAELMAEGGWNHPLRTIYDYGNLDIYKCFAQYIDLKHYLEHNDFEDYCPAHNFHQDIFDFIYGKLVEYDIKIEDFEFLTDDNNYIAKYAKDKLFALKSQRIANKGEKRND